MAVNTCRHCSQPKGDHEYHGGCRGLPGKRWTPYTGDELRAMPGSSYYNGDPEPSVELPPGGRRVKCETCGRELLVARDGLTLEHMGDNYHRAIYPTERGQDNG